MLALPELNFLNSPRGIKSWLYTIDHKRIGLMYLFAIMFFFTVGGLFAMLIRLELLRNKFPQLFRWEQSQRIIDSALKKRALSFIKDAEKNPPTTSYKEERGFLPLDVRSQCGFDFQRFPQCDDLLEFVQNNVYKTSSATDNLIQGGYRFVKEF